MSKSKKPSALIDILDQIQPPSDYVKKYEVATDKLLDPEKFADLTADESRITRNIEEFIKQAMIEICLLNDNPFRSEHIVRETVIANIAYYSYHLKQGVVPLKPMDPFDYTEGWAEYLDTALNDQEMDDEDEDEDEDEDGEEVPSADTDEDC